jgi:hypothetical protein
METEKNHEIHVRIARNPAESPEDQVYFIPLSESSAHKDVVDSSGLPFIPFHAFRNLINSVIRILQ